jgi:hypothetical protein
MTSISNYLDKLQEQVNMDLSMYDEESLASTPPPRKRRPTILYAQAAKSLAFQVNAGQKLQTNNNSNNTMTTSVLTLTQDSLNKAMEQIRHETAQSIEKLRQELQTEVLSMENNTATAVINALKTPQAIAMDTENSEEMSNQSTTNECGQLTCQQNKYLNH